MNPHASKSISPLELVKSIIRNRTLIQGLVKREIIGRYRGSFMGLLWSFFNPLLMLAVYTFVFSVVFKARWVGGIGSKTEFAMVLFAGLTAFNLFSEGLLRGPSLILGNANYVKKVIFPLEILPVVVLGSAFFHFLISFAAWLIFYCLLLGAPPLTIFQLPLILLPLVLMSLGLSWLLASLGVFLRDIGQIIGVLTMVLMYVTPIFYPVAALPENYQFLMHLNPLTASIEQVRNAMIFGHPLDWSGWLRQLALGAAVAWLGFAWFQKTRKAFADVV
ncbi:ABC transporter permease [Diaphorobacter ruginosibacter]|uniref:Transport permease protein n=1 Tax=Diaphorobacter ruginosibacter TaxID=1715720 RepID=A0A7G9RIM9_9BURK|nr:ABC transporter permease [Diaphorobacter ruginosibacter]QNN55454.1 ABC transporter permease [Diaphorobacter ruginosibacter]